MLVNIGKALPFVVCFVVAICYMENIVALATQDYLAYNDGYILNTPISFAIGSVFKYDLTVVVVLATLAYAIKTCKWHKLCIGYLALQIVERNAVQEICLPQEAVFTIAAANVSVCVFLIKKGINH